MIRANRPFINWLVILALLAQVLPVVAQDKAINKPGIDINPAPVAEAFVEVARPSPFRGNVTVNWKAGAPEGVTIKGFDVALDINFSNGQSQRLNRSVGGDERSVTFNIRFPESPKVGGEPPKLSSEPPRENLVKADAINCELQCSEKGKNAKEVEQCRANCRKNAAAQTGGKGESKKLSDNATPRRFGEGSISGGGQGNSGKAFGGAKGSGGAGSGGGNDSAPTRFPSADPITIRNLRATVTGKFSAAAAASAFREFVPPADRITGELTPKAARNRGADNLAPQINKLVHISEIAQRARECPSGQDCFELMAQSRGSGQFKVSLEAIYTNGQRKTTSRAVSSLSRLIPLNVDKPAGAGLSSALVKIIAEAAGDFTRTDTAGVALLDAVAPVKK